MTQLCQHCATPYAEDSGVEGFCCAGCRQVYLLIQDEGFGDYYQWQDRAAQPVKDRALSDTDAAAFCRLQDHLESTSKPAQAIFAVEGMSCMGCAWLIERLAAHQEGLLDAESSLPGRTIRLQWRMPGFDLAAFAAELKRFGYRIDAEVIDPARMPRWSPLAMRFILSTIFASNSLLLVAYVHFVGRSILADLLSLACLAFTLLVGAAPFYLAAIRATRIRRWHSDWLPVVWLTLLMIGLGIPVFQQSVALTMATFVGSLFVVILLAARLIARSLRRFH